MDSTAFLEISTEDYMIASAAEKGFQLASMGFSSTLNIYVIAAAVRSLVLSKSLTQLWQMIDSI